MLTIFFRYSCYCMQQILNNYVITKSLIASQEAEAI